MATPVTLVSATGPVIDATTPLPTQANLAIAGTNLALGQATAANSLPVTMASNQAPINVSDATVVITVSVTLTVGATYASGDFVGTSTTPISFANAVRTSGGSATIRSVTISDPAKATATALELWLFNATVTLPADSAAFDLSDADGLKCVGIINIPTSAQFASSATAVMHVANPATQYHCAATTLFGALVTRGTPGYTGTLQVMLEVEYDQ